ncbi:MAG: glycosyltransferase family protein [Bacteroidota bacterium]
MRKKRILIAPLDWGLGHAARCIPLIRHLLEKDCEVMLGADGRALSLLEKEFPGLEHIIMPGYAISYPRHGSMALKMAAQAPKILRGIANEHDQLEKLVRDKKPDAVISDNRFGLWSKHIPCVFMTHQVMIKSPFGEGLLHRLNRQYISRYTECWVPDVGNGLSGDLGSRFALPANTRYIGPLSRFEPGRRQVKSKRQLLVLLSGPEPQRTLFEKKICDQLAGTDIKALIVQGITEKNEHRMLNQNTEVVSHLTSQALSEEIPASGIVLSRPGYTTIMDLCALGKKAFFVPTPGQTEQEYLARTLMEKRIAYAMDQKSFDLTYGLQRSEEYTGFTDAYPFGGYKAALNRLIAGLGN